MDTAAPEPVISDTLFATIVGYLVPSFLAGAGGDLALARWTVLRLLADYRPVTPPELDLAGRIIGFGAAASDSLRLSMRPGLPDGLIASFRKTAIALNRTSLQCHAVLDAMQQRRAEAERRRAEAAKLSAATPSRVERHWSEWHAVPLIAHSPAPPDPAPAATHQDADEHPLPRRTLH